MLNYQINIKGTISELPHNAEYQSRLPNNAGFQLRLPYSAGFEVRLGWVYLG